MRKGFFGGTFDPIHLGHLNLIIELKEKCHLDQVLICPAHQSPIKEETPPHVSKAHRLEMVKRAIEPLSWVEVTEIELSRPPPSFTVETLKLLQKEDKEKIHYFLLLSEDSAYSLSDWKDVSTILSLAKPLVGTRHGFDRDRFEEGDENIKEKVKEGWVSIPAMDISSTTIRERLKNGLYCGHLLPGKVLDYIYENRLYYDS